MFLIDAKGVHVAPPFFTHYTFIILLRPVYNNIKHILIDTTSHQTLLKQFVQMKNENKHGCLF
jgi:hypothetical protein